MKILRTLSFIVLIPGLIFLATLQLLPNFLSHHLIPALAQKNGLPLLSLDIETISNNYIHFSHLRLGSKDKEAVYIESGSISYSFGQLLNGNLQKLTLNGLQCCLPPGKKQGEMSPNEKEAISSRKILTVFNDLPIRLADLQITNSRCNLHIAEENIVIPFNLKVHLADLSIPRFELLLDTDFQGNPLSMQGILDFTTNNFQIDLLARDFPLNNSNPFLKNIPLHISSIAKIKGMVSGTIFPFRPQYNCAINLNNLKLDYLNLKLGPPESVTNREQSVAINLMGDYHQLTAKISDIAIDTPITTIINSSTIQLNRDNNNNTVSGVGNLSMTILPIAKSSFQLPEPVTLWNSFTFRMTDKAIKGNSKIIVKPSKTSSSKKLSFITSGHLLQSSPITISISGQKTPKLMHINYKAFSSFIQSNTAAAPQPQPPFEIQGADISLTGTLTDEPGHLHLTPFGEFNLSIKQLSGNNSKLTGKATVKLTGQVKQLNENGHNIPKLSATLDLKKGAINLVKQKVSFSEITANIPLAWPLQQKRAKEGSLKIPHISMPDYDLGSLTAKIILKKGSYNIDANLLHKLIPHLTTSIKAHIFPGDKSTPANSTIIYSWPKYHFDTKKIDLPIFSEIKATGNIEIQGSAEISPQGISGSYKVAVTDATFHTNQSNITVSGLNLDLNIPNIRDIKSGPSDLSFQGATIGEMHLNGGKAKFQLENIEDLLIEHSSINWSSGKVHVLGTRVTSGGKKQDITLYCEGLNLAELLSQLGVANASGEGQVNGKISLSIKDGMLTFSDAFLYSTPGTGGTIKVNNSEIILSGLPVGSPQYGQLEFASAALKDFRYKWVTLNLISTPGDTILALKLAGKPANPLPFSYDTTRGTFVRLSEKNKGIDYPINLDVNFHLPLNKLLNYGTNLKNIFSQ